MSTPFLLHALDFQPGRSPLQSSSTVFVAIHPDRTRKVNGWRLDGMAGERADIRKLVGANGSSVPAFGVWDRRRSVVKGTTTKGSKGACFVLVIRIDVILQALRGRRSVSEESREPLIKADGREDEREDDFEDGEDDVGKERKHSQIARGVPGAADRSLPPVGRERSGEGEDGFRTRRTRLKSKNKDQGRSSRARTAWKDREKFLNRNRHDPVLPSDASRRPGGEGITRAKIGFTGNYWRRPTGEQEQDEGPEQDGETHWKMLSMQEAWRPAGRELNLRERMGTGTYPGGL
ncbi:hypothetical protein L226DRAFT_569098 [Lentinus tigrinus ALCF2SS1-7]|uniref:uncharacterized protein n=1 Tax=Lentinus tigrinus ALCF2SS1-7 TaxID=1328758 RepID=UPI001165EA08|nr:hypothetical protein L226DRAFT_569098 [Lentinus tigrinus ALCF2SS1-7]